MVRRAPPPLPPHATSTYATQLNQLDLIGKMQISQLECSLMNATQHQPVLVQGDDYFPPPRRNPSLEKPCTTVSLGIIKDLKQTSSVCFFGLTNFSRQCALSSAGC